VSVLVRGLSVLAVAVGASGCAGDPHWNLTTTAMVPTMILDDAQPSASFHVQLTFDGPLVAPDGSLGYVPDLAFQGAVPEGWLDFKATLYNEDDGFESWVSNTIDTWSAPVGNQIRTFAWRGCQDGCTLDYTLTVERVNPSEPGLPALEVGGLLHTYLTDVGDDVPPPGAAITMTVGYAP